MSSIKRKRTRSARKATFALLFAITVACHAPINFASDHVSTELTAEAKETLERRIDGIANEVANRKPYFEDDPLPIHIRSEFDVVSNRLIMDMDERLGPVSGYGRVEDLESDVQEAIWPLVKDIPGFKGLEWRFGGEGDVPLVPERSPEGTTDRAGKERWTSGSDWGWTWILLPPRI
ncbi:hypothetical protein [Luteibacter yeojuensis]|uniref:Uncharacterized protein n=1 Tax=Luteibacter yeojuensis TaxID=345309 RepID=A0A7X5TS48_9GAMM|nr:hypothetical protein [Luteibacter yeojuensis]NID17403.1 hypothetical protein [Luteibacter yeojuensis]